MIVGVYIGSVAVLWAATYAQTYFVGWVGQRALQDLRERIYSHLQRMSIGFFTRRKPGVLISRLTNDVQALDTLVTDGVITLFQSTLTLVGVVVILLLLDVPLALVTFVTFPILALASVAFRIISADAYRLTREKIANITAYLQETLSGVRVVRTFGREDRHVARMAELNDENRVANMRTVYLNASYFPAVELLSAIGTAVILLYGGYRVIDGDVEIGLLVAFVGYLAQFFDPIQQISQLYTTYQQGMAALDKIFDLLDTEPDMVDSPDAVDPGEIAGEIELDGVWFSYAGGGDASAAEVAELRSGEAARKARGRGRSRGSTSTCRRARRSRWSARRAPASRRWRSSSRASTTRSAAGCWSTATTCATCARRRCAASSGSCRRRASCSRGRSARTSPSGARTPTTRRSSPRRGRSAPTSSSTGSPTATRPRSASAARSSRPASASSSPSPGRCSPSRGS